HIAFVDTHVKTVHSGDVSSANHEVFVYEGDRAAVGVYCPVSGPGPNGDWAPGVSCGARAMAPAAAAVGVPGPRELYLVFFDFNKSAVTAAGRQVLNEAADAYRKGRPVRIEVTGYTDTVGSQQYNLGLSKRRADAAASYLAQAGVPMNRMDVAWKGKEDLRVPTPNDVREPQNRRVEIVTP
ncbi:MAG: OmpA family protein, partial [Stellaceae bacterium]